VLLERSTGVSVTILLISLGVLLPLSFFVGVLVTFRVAGPLYRFERHLETIAAGQDPGVCRIRKGDELHDFCTTFNAASIACGRTARSRRRPSRRARTRSPSRCASTRQPETIRRTLKCPCGPRSS
jgi:hypothetical protein